METVMITGGSGFLGSAITERLLQRGKYDIVVVSSRHGPDRRSAAGVRWEQADLFDGDAAEALMDRVRPDILCHFAWRLGEKGFHSSEENLRCLESGFRLVRRFTGRRIVYAGTGSEYGVMDGSGQRIWSLYGASKLMFETLAREHCRKNGVSFAAGRFFAVYGPGDMKTSSALPDAIRALFRREPFCCQSPENMWDYVYIDDAAEAMARLIGSDVEGVLDIGTGRPISMREVFTRIAENTGNQDCLTFNAHPPAGSKVVADVTRLRDELHYTCQTPFAEGIAKTVAWWRERENASH